MLHRALVIGQKFPPLPERAALCSRDYGSRDFWRFFCFFIFVGVVGGGGEGKERMGQNIYLRLTEDCCSFRSLNILVPCSKLFIYNLHFNSFFLSRKHIYWSHQFIFKEYFFLEYSLILCVYKWCALIKRGCVVLFILSILYYLPTYRFKKKKYLYN